MSNRLQQVAGCQVTLFASRQAGDSDKSSGMNLRKCRENFKFICTSRGQFNGTFQLQVPKYLSDELTLLTLLPHYLRLKRFAHRTTQLPKPDDFKVD